MSETYSTVGGISQLPVADLNTTLTYDGSNNLQTMSVTYQGTVYVKTFTYVGSNCTNISAWIAQ